MIRWKEIKRKDAKRLNCRVWHGFVADIRIVQALHLFAESKGLPFDDNMAWEQSLCFSIIHSKQEGSAGYSLHLFPSGYGTIALWDTIEEAKARAEMISALWLDSWHKANPPDPK